MINFYLKIFSDHGDEPKPSTSTEVSSEVTVTTPTKITESIDLNLSDLGTLDTGPAQPNLDKFPSTTFGKQARCFSSKYYLIHSWIEYSVYYDAVFCFPCRLFGAKAALPSHGEEVYLRLGMRNWKKINQKLEKHATSAFHIGNIEKWRNHKMVEEKSMNTHIFLNIFIHK